MGAQASILEDKYFLQKVKLGQGSFGVVWRGTHIDSGAFVAVKQMDKAQLPRRGVKREDIEREVNVMKVVRHENILQLMDFYEDNKNISFVLEYCDGGDFGDKVKERQNNLTEAEAAVWTKMILSAICALHRKEVCHRDIKPDNFMVSNSVIKLADFGLAIILPANKGLLTEKCGTPAFMAPEQHALQSSSNRSRGYNHSVDMWAAGITMFMLVSGGRHPFVDGNGKLKERELASGELDFSAQQGFLAVFQQRQGFSDQARNLCRRMVNPDCKQRATAEQALKDPWVRDASSAQGAVTSRPQAEAPVPPQAKPAGGYPAQASPPIASPVSAGEAQRPQLNRGQTWPLPQLAEMNLGGLLNGFWGEDQNQTPNVAGPPAIVRPTGQAKPPVAPGSQQQDVRVLQKQLQDMDNRLKAQEAAQVDQRRSAMEGMAAANQAVSSMNGQGVLNQRSVSGPAGMQNGQTMRATDKRRTEPAQAMVAPRTNVNMGSQQLRGKLPPNCKVRYMSQSYPGWLPGIIDCWNDSDGTYDLNVRQHAKLENISPDPKVTASEAWPNGTLVQYQSQSAQRWLAAVIVSFVEGGPEGNGMYNLDLRECAEVDRIRPRAA